MNVKTKRAVTFVMAILMAAAIVLPALSTRADASNAGTQYFTDVTPDKWYYEAVNAMAAAGILNGYGDGTFKPNNPMTAGELATVLWNMVYGDLCKATELWNAFNNGYSNASYNESYPGPRVEKWGHAVDAWSPYRVPYNMVYPNTWDGPVALTVYGDMRLDKGVVNVPYQSSVTQLGQGRCSGTIYNSFTLEAKNADAIYYRDMSGLAIVAMSKEPITRGFAISELVNMLRQTGNLKRLYDASGNKSIYTDGSAIPDWAAITDAYHDICAGSAKNANEASISSKSRFHDYTWAWNYIDDPGNIKIQGGYANTWFSRDVLLAYQAGIIDGVDATGRCNVGAAMTRAEVCQMLYNAGAGKTKLKPLAANMTACDGARIMFIRDGKVYDVDPVPHRVAGPVIYGFGPYNANSNRTPAINYNNAIDIYYPSGGIDLRQQEWPTHPEFWGK